MSSHKWDRDGERCVKCGDKDWMGTQCSVADPPELVHAESPDCWCGPTLDYVDGETGRGVYVHHKGN